MITKVRKTNAVMADKTDDFSDFSFELAPNLYALCFTDNLLFDHYVTAYDFE